MYVCMHACMYVYIYMLYWDFPSYINKKVIVRPAFVIVKNEYGSSRCPSLRHVQSQNDLVDTHGSAPNPHGVAHCPVPALRRWQEKKAPRR